MKGVGEGMQYWRFGVDSQSVVCYALSEKEPSMADILFIISIFVLFWLCTLYVRFADRV